MKHRNKCELSKPQKTQADMGEHANSAQTVALATVNFFLNLKTNLQVCLVICWGSVPDLSVAT